VKLVRSGTTVTGSVSRDGRTWMRVGQTTIAMSATLTVGLAVTSHANSVLSRAVFDRVAVATIATTRDVDVNFQPAASPTVTGYLVDSGAAFADRGNGLTYGWNLPTLETRDRNLTTDQLRDTLNHLQKPSNPQAVWEVAVPDGRYQVRVVSGDPSAFDSVFKLDVEGVRAVDGTPTNANRWVEGTVSVTVTDGRLTLSNGSGASNNKVCFVEIVAIPSGVAFLSDGHLFREVAGFR
jgi:hypothetical protein